MSDELKPPKGLRPETRRWWLRVVDSWELEAHHIRLLTSAARAWDEGEKAAALVKRDGLLVTMPSGIQRAHPAVRIANEARALYARLLRELDLDIDAPATAARPPALRSIRGGSHAA